MKADAPTALSLGSNVPDFIIGGNIAPYSRYLVHSILFRLSHYQGPPFMDEDHTLLEFSWICADDRCDSSMRSATAAGFEQGPIHSEKKLSLKTKYSEVE